MFFICGASDSIEELQSQPYSCPMCKTPNSVILTRKTTKLTFCFIPVSKKTGKPVYRCQMPRCHWAGPMLEDNANPQGTGNVHNTTTHAMG